MKRNYASTQHMNAWLRHPVLGDPSFDTFERVGDTVHRSEPPYEWTVNGSLFRDFDGAWYCYAGLYPSGYVRTVPARARTYRSYDKGLTWEDLGWTLDESFTFDGDKYPTLNGPDVFLAFDKKTGKYLLTYDNSTCNATWETAHDLRGTDIDAGAALAWADSPAGPFHRYPMRFLSDYRFAGACGKWSRLYASCVIPREKDYIAFCLADSNMHFAWALATMTAPTPEGPWSLPHIILSCETPGYYPCPMEFFPVELRGDKVLAHATSVARNRNYEVTFCADLEKAHHSDAWTLIEDGNIFHAHDHPDEHFGMWGQTFHGFVEDGQYIVMYPSKDCRDYGTINIASRPLDKPHSDGFTLTGHGSASVSPLKAAYGALTLEAAFTSKGTIDIAFDYNGILGPNRSSADSVADRLTLANYSAVRICGTSCQLITVSDTAETVCHISKEFSTPVTTIKLTRTDCSLVSVWANGELLCDQLPISFRISSPAIIVHEFCRMDCSHFSIEGEPLPYTWRWNAEDALLGAGQLMPPEEHVQPDALPERDRWFRVPGSFVGEGLIAAKWNLHGDEFTVQMQKYPGFGIAGVWVDGHFYNSLDLNGEGALEYTVTNLRNGPHAIWVKPIRGKISITGCIAKGDPAEN